MIDILSHNYTFCLLERIIGGELLISLCADVISIRIFLIVLKSKLVFLLRDISAFACITISAF
jgi:hypothetical protein